MMDNCPECHHCGGFHAMNCQSVLPEQWPEHFRRYVSTMDSMIKRRDEALKYQHHMLTFWQGKFAIVKHENNQLRKKLR